MKQLSTTNNDGDSTVAPPVPEINVACVCGFKQGQAVHWIQHVRYFSDFDSALKGTIPLKPFGAWRQTCQCIDRENNTVLIGYATGTKNEILQKAKDQYLGSTVKK